MSSWWLRGYSRETDELVQEIPVDREQAENAAEQLTPDSAMIGVGATEVPLSWLHELASPPSVIRPSAEALEWLLEYDAD